MVLEDFDGHKFAIISIPFAVAIVIVFIVWVLINRYKFKWRGALLGRLVISHGIHSTPDSCNTKVLLGLYWIFFLLPFLLFIAWGSVVAAFFKPYYIGVIIALGPTSILLIMYIYCDYHYRGYVATGLSKFGLFISFLLIVAVTACSIYLLDRKSWIEIAYLFAFPPSLFFMISYTYSHYYIPNKVFEYALEDQAKMDDFIELLSNHDKTCFKGSKRLNFWWSLAHFFFSLIVNFLYQLNYWFIDTKNEIKKRERDAAFYSAIGFFLIDFLLLLAQAGTKIRPGFFFIIFLGYIVKIVAITFTERFWLVGHGVVFFFLSSFLMIRFIMGFWKPIKSADLRGSEDKKVKMLSNLMNKTRKMPKVTVVLSFISWIILVAALVFEIMSQHKKEFEALPIPMTQIDALFGLAVMSIPFSMLVCSCYYLYNNCGIVTAGTYIMYFLSVIIIVVFDVVWKGIKDIMLLRILVPTDLVFVFSCMSVLLIYYYYNKEASRRKEKGFGIFYGFMTLASMALTLILPLTLEKNFKQKYSEDLLLSGFMLVMVVLTVQFYAFFVVSFLNQNSFLNAKTISFFILSIVSLIFLSICTFKLVTGIVVFCTVIVIFCIAFSFSYTKHNDWTFSLAPYLIIAIPSLIIFVLSILVLVKSKNDDINFYAAIVAFASAFFLFGSSLFFWLQKKNFYFNWASIICAIVLAIAVIAVIAFTAYKFKKGFIVVSIILLCIFIASLLGMICFILSQSIANVIVVSNVFFPIRRLVNGKIKTLSVFNILYCLTFVSCWLWGLFGSIFFDNHPEYGPLASTGAILLIGFITCFFITQFDSNTYSSLKFIHKEEIKYAINTAMSVSNINIELVSPDKPDISDYLAYMDYIEKLIAARKNVSLFLSSLKAELFVASDVAFRSARNQIHNYFRDLDYTDEELEFLTYETGWLNSEKLKVYALLAEINDNDTLNQKKKDYDNKLKKQQEKRMKVKINTDKDKSFYKKLVSRMEQSNQLFADSEYNGDIDKDSFTTATWRRMEEVYTNPMFDQNAPFNANYIKQGYLGDCYLVSAMVAISRSPKAIQQIFTDPINNKAGVRCVNLHIMGKVIPVVVDTMVPFSGTSQSSKPIACQPIRKEDQWWATIVEKAYAKQYGSYKAIDGGNSHIALYRLVGGFPRYIILSDLKEKEKVQNGTMWRQLLKWHNQGSFICAGSNAGSDQDKTPHGIRYGHAYTVLQIVDIYGNKLLQLRNPWGNGEWTGDWSDKSPKWTPKMKEALKFRDEEDGVFWMSFNDFTNNFRAIYATINTGSKFNCHFDGTFIPGENDGADPFCRRGVDARCLKQFVIRPKSTSSQPTLSIIVEKTGGSVTTEVFLVYNSGEKLTRLKSGMEYSRFYMFPSMPLLSFQWTYEHPKMPVNLMISREKSNEPTDWHVELFSDYDLEITKLE